jgi:hypothetical protein
VQPVDHWVAFTDTRSRQDPGPPLASGVGVGLDVNTGSGTHAFGVRTTLGSDMLHVMAFEEMAAVQQAWLGEQTFDVVAQPPGMSFVAESELAMAEVLTGVLEALTSSAGSGSGENLGGHKDSFWKKENRVSLKLISNLEDLKDHMFVNILHAGTKVQDINSFPPNMVSSHDSLTIN